jgi:hypothetical protein
MATINKKHLINLQKKYTTDNAIGKRFGITRQAVHQLRTKYGIPPVTGKNAPRNAAIIKASGNGISCVHIARKFKMSTSQIYRIIRQGTV